MLFLLPPLSLPSSRCSEDSEPRHVSVLLFYIYFYFPAMRFHNIIAIKPNPVPCPVGLVVKKG